MYEAFGLLGLCQIALLIEQDYYLEEGNGQWGINMEEKKLMFFCNFYETQHCACSNSGFVSVKLKTMCRVCLCCSACFCDFDIVVSKPNPIWQIMKVLGFRILIFRARLQTQLFSAAEICFLHTEIYIYFFS